MILIAQFIKAHFDAYVLILVPSYRLFIEKQLHSTKVETRLASELKVVLIVFFALTVFEFDGFAHYFSIESCSTGIGFLLQSTIRLLNFLNQIRTIKSIYCTQLLPKIKNSYQISEVRIRRSLEILVEMINAVRCIN